MKKDLDDSADSVPVEPDFDEIEKELKKSLINSRKNKTKVKKILENTVKPADMEPTEPSEEVKDDVEDSEPEHQNIAPVYPDEKNETYREDPYSEEQPYEAQYGEEVSDDRESNPLTEKKKSSYDAMQRLKKEGYMVRTSAERDIDRIFRSKRPNIMGDWDEAHKRKKGIPEYFTVYLNGEQ